MKYKIAGGMSHYGHLTGISDSKKEYTSKDILDKLNKLEEEVEHWKEEFYKMWYWEYCGSDETKIEMFEEVFNRSYTEKEWDKIIWG